MKKTLLATNFIALAFITTAQSKLNESRQTKSIQRIREFDWTTTAIKQDNAGNEVIQTFPKRSRFTIADETTLPSHYIVYFWDWSSSTVATSNYQKFNFNSATNDRKYFAIDKREIDIVSEKIFRLFSPSIGAMTFPFKYRPQNGKFEKTLAIGVTGGVTWNPTRINTHTFSLLGGVSASSATLDKYTTGPAANIMDATDRTAVTFSLNFVYQWEHLQIGISAGMDNILENEIVKWSHQGHGWLSIGIGVALFTASDIKNSGRN